MVNLKDQLKSTDQKIKGLERTIEIERSNVSWFKEENDKMENTIWEKNQELLELNRKQKELEKLISKIPPELLEQIRQQEIQARRKRERGWER